MPAEPGVTITDYLLALQCAWATWWCWRRHGAGRTWCTLFFASLSAAAVLGGTMHGYVATDGEALHEGLWLGTLLSIGATALAMWGMTGAIAARPRLAGWLVATGAVLAGVYAAAVLGGARAFTIALAVYLPPALALLAAFAAAWRRSRDRRLACGMAGVALTFVAAGIQAARIDLHPVWCDHNALYHLVQMVALGCVWVAAAALLAAPRPAPAEVPCPR